MRPPRGGRRPQHTIMIVDDSPTNLQILIRILEGSGHRILVAKSGQAALKIVGQERPDVVLLDVMMPGMDGFSTLRALRELPQTATTPVVFVTARAQPHEIEQYRRGGACDVILKPFEPSELSDRLRGIWSRIHGEADREPA